MSFNRLMRIGIDLGGTKIEGIILGDDGGEVARRRVPTPRDDYAGTVAAIADLVRWLEEKAGASGVPVGIGTPGALSAKTGLIKNSNSTWLIGKPLDRDLKSKLRREIKMANDANCFALSEATDGAAAGASNVFGVILGTGVGGGIVMNGSIVNGANGIAGEWGHNSLPWPDRAESPGPACYCGRSGCIETFLSGPGFARDYKSSFGGAGTPSGDLRAEEIVDAALKKNPDALAALEKYERRLAKALAMVINIVDPDVIVLGGGFSNVGRLYENVPRHWGKWIFSDTVETKLVRAKFGDSSGVRGAAWLSPQ